MIQCLYLQNLHFLETGGAVPYLVQLYASPLVKWTEIGDHGKH